MDGLLVCGGRGSRVGPLGALINKCLLPVGGRTVLEWSARLLIECFGCDRVVYSTGHLADQVESFIRACDGFGSKYVFVRDHDSSSTYAALRGAMAGLSDPFVYSHGNIALGVDATRRLAGVADVGHTTVAISTAPHAPTHPHFRVENSVVTAVGALSAELPYCSVGIGIYYLDSFVDAALARDRRGPVEYFLSPDCLASFNVNGVDIGDGWIHLEDLSVYRDLLP